MKDTCRRFVLAFVALALALTIAPNALARCGGLTASKGHPANWDPQYGRAYLMNMALTGGFHDDTDSIVGMWHVTFTAEGNNGAPPDNTPIDNAIVVWHSDKTEIMNSGRPPQDGDFCMGVWEETAKSTYKLNHFAWGGNDTTNAPGGIGNPVGPAHYVELVTLSSDGKSYTGTFTLDAYDTSGNVTTHIVGVIKATRITLDTTVNDLL
jgi:hypothetical protein